MKVFSLTLIAIVLFLAACSPKTSGQRNEDVSGQISEMIESRDYTFKATSAIPARGRTIQLNSAYYDLRIKGDTVVAELPYFGRAYTAPIGQTDGGIRFTSTDFTYNQNIKSNGVYEIEIIPKDKKDVQRMFLSVSKSGYGNLYVNSNNRESISFNGRIEKSRAR